MLVNKEFRNFDVVVLSLLKLFCFPAPVAYVGMKLVTKSVKLDCTNAKGSVKKLDRGKYDHLHIKPLAVNVTVCNMHEKKADEYVTHL